jgi:hypothetical protein
MLGAGGVGKGAHGLRPLVLVRDEEVVQALVSELVEEPLTAPGLVISIIVPPHQECVDLHIWARQAAQRVEAQARVFDQDRALDLNETKTSAVCVYSRRRGGREGETYGLGGALALVRRHLLHGALDLDEVERLVVYLDGGL